MRETRILLLSVVPLSAAAVLATVGGLHSDGESGLQGGRDVIQFEDAPRVALETARSQCAGLVAIEYPDPNAVEAGEGRIFCYEAGWFNQFIAPDEVPRAGGR